jgi:two-component system sensor histidine kinase KdpD
MLFSYFAIAAVLGNLTSRIKQREQAVSEKEKRTRILYETTFALSSTENDEQVLNKISMLAAKAFNVTSTAVLLSPTLRLLSEPSGTVSDKDRAVMEWSRIHKKKAGRFTDNLSASAYHCIPLIAGDDMTGVLALKMDTKKYLTLEERLLLDAMSYHVALSLIKHEGDRQKKEAQLSEESNRLYKNLLSSISHELRTPLTVIHGSATAVLEESNLTLPVTALTKEIVSASEQMNQLVGNLLDMNRLESGHLKLRLQWHDPVDMIHQSISDMSRRLTGHRIKINLEEGSQVFIDYVLMQQVISNLLQNAAKYSPEGSEITLTESVSGGFLEISVEDQGLGIPESELEKIFDSFHRIPGSVKGVGLGLSICRGFVEAHHGTIRAERLNNGTRFIIRIPSGDSYE